MRRWVIVLGLLGCWGAWQHWQQREVRHSPGSLVDVEPEQTPSRVSKPFRFRDHTLTRHHEFRLTARVLSRADYSLDRGASLAPTDLALGWNRMSDGAVLAAIDIHQTGRFYLWRSQQPPIPASEIGNSSANMHLIPANADVAAALARVRVGDIIAIIGALVDAEGNDGWRWRSSRTRSDSGDGACELVYVEHLSIRS